MNTHRYHHQYTDTERDPHSPVQGFWFSYVIWTFDTITLTKKVCPEYFIDYKDKERGAFSLVTKYGTPNNVADMENDAFYRFIHDTYLLHPIALGVLLYAVGGTPFFLWGMVNKISLQNMHKYITFFIYKGLIYIDMTSICSAVCEVFNVHECTLYG